MNDHLTDVSHERHGAEPRGTDRAGRARPSRARQVGRARRALRDVPPPGGPRQGRHGPGPRHRRALHRRTRGRLARGRARPVRHPDAADARALRPVRVGGPRAARPVVGGRAAPPGVTRPDPFYPLAEATNEPPPTPRWTTALARCGQKRRGIALDGRGRRRLGPAGGRHPVRASDRPRLLQRERDAIAAQLEATRRDPAAFDFGAQIPTGDDRRRPRQGPRAAHEALRRGATHLILDVRPKLGPDGVDVVADRGGTAAAAGHRMSAHHGAMSAQEPRTGRPLVRTPRYTTRRVPSEHVTRACPGRTSPAARHPTSRRHAPRNVGCGAGSWRWSP